MLSAALLPSLMMGHSPYDGSSSAATVTGTGPAANALGTGELVLVRRPPLLPVTAALLSCALSGEPSVREERSVSRKTIMKIARQNK